MWLALWSCSLGPSSLGYSVLPSWYLQHRWRLSWVNSTAISLGRFPMVLAPLSVLDSPLWLKFHLPNFMQWPCCRERAPPPIACTQQLSETLVSPTLVPLLFLYLSCLQKQCYMDGAPSSASSRCSLSVLNPSCRGLCVFEGALGEARPWASILQQGAHVVALSV